MVRRDASIVDPDTPPSAGTHPVRELSDWRRRVLDITLGVTAGLAGVAYLPGVVAAWNAGLPVVVVADTVALVVVLTLALARGLSYLLRATAFVGLIYVLSVLLILQIGPVGGGVLWLLAFPVLAAVLFGPRGATVSLLVTTVTVVALGFAAGPGGVGPAGLEGPAGAEGPSRYDLVSWFATSASLVFLAAVLSLSIAYLMRSLEGAVEEARSSREQLQDSHRELHREMEERRRLEAQLLQSQKMEALGTLAGGIAHDFNNLLLPILLETRELRERFPEGSQEQQSLDAVARSASRARDLVRGILTYSRGLESERRPVEVEPVLREVAELLRSTLPAGAGIELQLEAGGALVVADQTELHQVLMNLGMNAFLALEEGRGTVRFVTGIVAADPQDAAAPEVLIDVHDSGRGMSPEVLERALDPFFTTRDPGEGTGLGLSIVHRVVTSLGGTLFLESTPGEGTHVRVRLPRAASSAEDAHPPRRSERREEPTTSAPPDTARLLFIDDEELVRRTARIILGRMGYQVLEADGPGAALELLDRDPTGIDLVITDQTMPGMTGIELAARIRELRPDVPILISSGYLDDGALARVEALGLQGILNKPYDREELQAGIQRALRGL